MTKEETLSYLKAYLNGDTAIGNIIPLRSVLESAVEYLEPSLPSNLDEAAEISDLEAKNLADDYTKFLAAGLTKKEPRPIGPRWMKKLASDRFKAGAEWMAGQVMMLKWKYPEEKYQYPECLTRIMDEYGDWHYTISEGHLNPDCEYISLAELSLRLATR